MRVTSACPKPMPPAPVRHRAWLLGVLWGGFCVAIGAMALLLSPEINVLPTAEADSAVPMAATVLYPNEQRVEGPKN